MTHITHVIDALYLEHMGLVAGEVRIGLDGSSHFVEFGTVLEFYIHHTAVDALTEGDGHTQSVLHTSLRAYADAVAHRHTRTEVGVRETLRSQTLHQGAHDRVAARIPACCNHTHGVGLLVEFHQTLTVATDLCVDIE